MASGAVQIQIDEEGRALGEQQRRDRKSLEGQVIAWQAQEDVWRKQCAQAISQETHAKQQIQRTAELVTLLTAHLPVQQQHEVMDAAQAPWRFQRRTWAEHLETANMEVLAAGAQVVQAKARLAIWQAEHMQAQPRSGEPPMFLRSVHVHVGSFMSLFAPF